MTGCCDLLDFVRGATFDMSGAALDDGVAYDFTGWTFTCQVRKLDTSGKPGALIADLTCEWLNAATGLLRIHSTTSTAAWLLGKAVLDVRFVDTLGNIVQSGKMELLITEAVTRV